MKVEDLRTSLQEWTDIEIAQFSLAVCLGIMQSDIEYSRVKHVFWSNHPVGEMLHDLLRQFVKLDILQYRESEDDYQFRWNPDFKGSWE